MAVAHGMEIYNVDSPPVEARGLAYTALELEQALRERAIPILQDADGLTELAEVFATLGLTQFDSEALRAALATSLPTEDWRVGEALAEAWLVDHGDCEFPWPARRDLRNPMASPAGAD